ncbi:Gfo/Idh/MocA family oxidoreductase [Adhaeribacter swui]|uniref:Gfo/Idh/MocA family oxidoreductase n=1 Tax=Adhaeribacter swui TaxID=2086471 RepID=A0A7G7G8P5_9BACT|nr:Gfo/Idh/MocA family oxidoreductase [Adhaeribacter swui]QNF33529.1 Gfo/Idh/MocA family oxidoreductase [Adhaeribacter swui]
MKNTSLNRRKFVKDTLAGAAGIAGLTTLPLDLLAAPNKIIVSEESTTSGEVRPSLPPKIKFAVIGLNHGHIYSQVEAVIRGGGQLISFYAKEDDLAAAFTKKYPQVKKARSEKEILEDKAIQLVVSASIPDERAPLGVRVMRHGKDFMVDKPGITSLEQLAEVRRVQKETKRIYSIMYSERLENKATVKAGELVKAGAIGKVIQTIGLGPHRMNPKTRPDWFFDRQRFGGIICDIASHQFDQYLYFTGSTQADVVAAQVGNVNHPQYPKFEDFGDAMLRGNKGMGYIRVDWFTPDGLKTWGDGRLTILGTEGFIEIRKNIDIGGREGGNHLFLTDQKEMRYVDCSKEPLPYGEQLVNDIVNRTETAMTQEHCFLATELALKAQQQAKSISI